MPAPGSRIDRLVVVGQLPPRAHRTVLRARDQDGSFVAVKVATSDPGAALVDHELRVLRSLGTAARPAPRLACAGSVDGRPFCATTWIRGSEARVVAAEVRERGTRAEALGLCGRVARACAALHVCGVLHGQVHPRHVLVDFDGTVGLIDLSLSSSPTDRPPPARLAARFNTLSAPEHAQALLRGRELTLTTAVEQYAVAALLYLLMTGRMYAPLALEREALAHDIIASRPLSFAEHGRDSWPELEAVIGRGLEKDPGQRHASVAAFADALDSLEADDVRRAPGRQGVASVNSPLARTLATFRRDVDSHLAIRDIAPPRCSINFGATGVAFALTRLGKLGGDASAFDGAARWLEAAERLRDEPDAFDDGDELTPRTVGVVSPYHSASGIAAVRSLLSEATGDRARQHDALDEFRAAAQAPCAGLDLTLGRSSVLLFTALLYAVADADLPATQRLADFASELCATIWRDAERTTLVYYGIAHGWAGLAYATLMWARARGTAPPAPVRAVLNTLAAEAVPDGRGVRWPLTPIEGPAHDQYWPGWCHGNAGYVFLWNLARETYGDGEFAELAERAAWLTDIPARVSSLCCGAAGQAYAALNHHRHTGEDRWRSLAMRIAESSATHDALAADAKTPLSLYKGHVGLALLAAELECPQRASMPLFEFEVATTPPTGG